MELQANTLFPSSFGAARKELDARISALKDKIRAIEEQIRELHTTQNLYTHISKLPDEILCNIFLHCKNKLGRSSPGNLDWIKVTHVCRRWRIAALDNPHLWSDITDTVPSGPCLEAMISRSKAALVSVNLRRDHLPDGIEGLLRGLLSQTSRLQELNLRGTSSVVQERLSSLALYAPHLQRLSLSSYGRDGDNECTVLPDHFLVGGAPRLYSLLLENCSISWISPLLRELTTFAFSYSREEPPIVSVQQIVQALERMPDLVELELDIDFPTDVDPLIPVPRVISLPNLKSILLKGSLAGCASLLGHLYIPPSASLELDCYESDIPATDAISTVFQSLWSLPSLDGSSNKRKLRSLSFSFAPFQGAHIQVWDERIAFQDGVICQTKPSISLALHHITAAGIIRVFSSLPVGDVLSMRLGDHFGSDSDLGKILGYFPSLEEIYLSKGIDTQFVGCLRNNLRTSPSLYLPRLQLISFYNSFLLDAANRSGAMFIAAAPILLDYLVTVIAYRVKRGSPINKLRFNSCSGLSDQSLARLRDVVPEVVWKPFWDKAN